MLLRNRWFHISSIGPLIVILHFFAGCAVNTFIDKGGFTKEQLAHVKKVNPDTKSGIKIIVSHVDGLSMIGLLDESFELLPGPHSLRVGLNKYISSVVLASPSVITITQFHNFSTVTGISYYDNRNDNTSIHDCFIDFTAKESAYYIVTGYISDSEWSADLRDQKTNALVASCSFPSYLKDMDFGLEGPSYVPGHVITRYRPVKSMSGLDIIEVCLVPILEMTKGGAFGPYAKEVDPGLFIKMKNGYSFLIPHSGIKKGNDQYAKVAPNGNVLFFNTTKDPSRTVKGYIYQKGAYHDKRTWNEYYYEGVKGDAEPDFVFEQI